MITNFHEYRPPDQLARRGFPIIHVTTYQHLSGLLPAVPSPADMRKLTGLELARCLQMEAPMRVLGVFPENVSVNRHVVLASSEGDLSTMLDLLERSLTEVMNGSGLHLRPRHVDDAIPSLFMNTNDLEEWHPVAISGATVNLHLGSGIVAEPET